MKKTIVAIYDDIAVARQVVEDLVNADFSRSSISLITNDGNNHYSHYLDEAYTPREDAVTAGEGAGFGAVVGGLTGILVGMARVAGRRGSCRMVSKYGDENKSPTGITHGHRCGYRWCFYRWLFV